jgi:hypothetical protein
MPSPIRRVARAIRRNGTPTRRALFFEAWCYLWVARLTLSLLPFRLWRAQIARMMQPPPDSAPSSAAWWVDAAWAIRAASHFVPDPTCLVRALAGAWLGARHHHPLMLVIGVAPAADQRLDAHAWLEQDGAPVVGGEVDVRRFARLPTFPLRSRAAIFR